MIYQEYPKGLVIGDVNGKWRIVSDASEEAQARLDGYCALGESQEQPQEPAKRRGRPPKVSAE